MTNTALQINAVAQIAGISVRTLHHYDALGLLVPARSDAGYRVYRDADLVRLQQILIRRALGMPLAKIKRSLDDPSFDLRAALTTQRGLLAERIAHTQSMLRAVDATLARIAEDGDPMTTKMNQDERLALFDGFDPAEHAAEAEDRWGATDAYAESARRTQGYSKADWARHQAQSAAIMTEAAALFVAGAAPNGVEAAAVVERHRQLVDEWFYPCDAPMHARLADMYEADPRFAANIDKHAADLTPWWSAAIRHAARTPAG